jgi:hypothetical protein
MDKELKSFLEANFKGIDQRFTDLQANIDAKVSPIKETVDRHTKDIADLYEKDRHQVTECEDHRKDMEKEFKEGKRWTAGQVIAIVCCVAAIGGSWIIAKFAGG